MKRSAGAPRRPSQSTRKSSDFRSALANILESAMKVGGARCGNIQMFNRASGGLEIFVQRGFNESFLRFFRVVRPGDGCACGRAFRLRKRVNIPDIAVDPYFGPYLGIAQEAGFRSVQSTPIVDADDMAVGVLSTHFPKVHRLNHDAMAALDYYAFAAAELISRMAKPGRVMA
jgi:two-component system, chemotaxis family, CheB/CheR fusion protein